MTKVFSNDYRYDRIVWFCGLPETEMGPTRRVTEDLEDLSRRSALAFRRYDPRNSIEFSGFLDAELNVGGNVLIHIDSHGSHEGIYIGNEQELVTWGKVCNWLRPINVQSSNSTLVVSNCCFGIFAISAVDMNQPAPFLGFLAPKDKTTVGSFESSVPQFYRHILTDDNFEKGLTALSEYDFWLADRFLMKILVRIAHKYSTSRGRQQVTEELVSIAKAKGEILIGESPADIRRKIKLRIRTVLEERYDKYLQEFLFGNTPSFTFEDILAAAKAI